MTLYDVIKLIAPWVAESQQIHAMWLEGSWATGKNHDDSDIDVWFDVDDGTFEESISTFRDALLTTNVIDWEKAKGVYSQDPKLQKHIFHLEGFPLPQRIELDLQEHSRNFVFKRDEHIVEVMFDKNGTIRWESY